jgi:nucleoside-diphosphate-sugar epimerase
MARILLLGGNGAVAKHLTPLLLSKSHTVTSVIRDPAQVSDLQKLGDHQPGTLKVLVHSLDTIQTKADAEQLIKQTGAQWVIWSAGAGGKGGPEQTLKIDRDAAKAVIAASVSSQQVTKFLLVSALLSRRNKPRWWNDKDWERTEKVQNEVMPTYAQAKIESDEYLASLADKRSRSDKGFQAINLRPGTLTHDKASGQVAIGHTSATGTVSREDVANVAFALLERDDTNGWFDLVSGDDSIEQAVEKAVKDGTDSFEGEDSERIFAIKE